jgi:hypothetical protein
VRGPGGSVSLPASLTYPLSDQAANSCLCAGVHNVPLGLPWSWRLTLPSVGSSPLVLAGGDLQARQCWRSGRSRGRLRRRGTVPAWPGEQAQEQRSVKPQRRPGELTADTPTGHEQVFDPSAILVLYVAPCTTLPRPRSGGIIRQLAASGLIVLEIRAAFLTCAPRTGSCPEAVRATIGRAFDRVGLIRALPAVARTGSANPWPPRCCRRASLPEVGQVPRRPSRLVDILRQHNRRRNRPTLQESSAPFNRHAKKGSVVSVTKFRLTSKANSW